MNTMEDHPTTGGPLHALWACTQWALLVSLGILQGRSSTPLLARLGGNAQLWALGALYLNAGAYSALTPLLRPAMRLVVLVSGLWAAWVVPYAGLHGLTMADLITVKGLPVPPGLTAAHLDPTFVGVNAFLICALATGLVDLFFRLVRRDWGNAGAVLAFVILLFFGERSLLNKYDSLQMGNFRTIVKEAFR
jgi:hypothetical protein